MVQKFVPRSVVGIFRNKRTRSSPLDPKLMCLVHFIQFWCIWDRLVDLRNSVQNGPNWYKSSWHEVASKFVETNAPDISYWALNSCFGAFRIILGHCDRLVDLQNSVQNGPNWCKSSCREVASEFFATIAPNLPHWTLNSCFGA